MQQKYERNEEKNKELIRTRNISFSLIIEHISTNPKCIISIDTHPNQEKYPWQKMMSVLIDDYVRRVPFVEQPWWWIFLKTIYPSHKRTKILLW